MYKVIVAYDGRNFQGFQKQPEARTVQGSLETVLSSVFQQEITIQASGRTDSGVHALGQVISFSLENEISTDKVFYVLNRNLPEDIKIRCVNTVNDSFHPRFDAIRKTYLYRLSMKDRLFLRPYQWFIRESLDIDAMKQAACILEGNHDFFSFSNRRKGERTTVRNLQSITLEKSSDHINIRYTANGFLYKMVRILTNFLVEVGRGNLEPTIVTSVLESHSRDFTRVVAPPNGLYLEKVYYDTDKKDKY